MIPYKFIRPYVFTILLVFISVVSFAQQAVLTVEGTVKEGRVKLSGATVTLTKSGTKVDKMTTTSNGKFIIDVPLGSKYVLLLSKPGYVTKRISIDASSVPEAQALDKHEFPMEVGLFKEMKGLDVSVLDKPIGQITYDSRAGYFDYDKNYTRSIQAQLDKLKKELDKKLKDEVLYAEVIVSADQTYARKDYENAIKLYEKAKKLKPSEKYPQVQIDKIGELLKDVKVYDDHITKADAAFNAKNYKEAKQEYKTASGIKPLERYPKEKLAELDKILKELAEAEAVEKEKEAQFQSLIANADKALAAKKYADPIPVY